MKWRIIRSPFHPVTAFQTTKPKGKKIMPATVQTMIAGYTTTFITHVTIKKNATLTLFSKESPAFE